MKLLKNTRYYKWEDDGSLTELRILKMQNESLCSVIFTKGLKFTPGTKKKIPVQELTDDYTKLRPDGYISFDIVTVGKKLKDVMVIITRQEDIQAREKTPYAVCRQCAVDLFAKQLSPDNVDYAGISVSKESCPADVKFENFLACETVELDETIAYYIGDSLDNILNLLRHTSQFDTVLTTLFNDHCDYITNNNHYISEVYKKTKNEINGYYKSLKDLLYWNNFEYDIYRAFDIIPLTVSKEDIICTDEIKDSVDKLTVYGMQLLSSIVCRNIYESIVLPYDKDIDMKKIQGSFMLIATNEGKVFLVAYKYNDNYKVPLESIESEENIEKLNNILPYGSVQNVYEHIQFRNGKYKS